MATAIMLLHALFEFLFTVDVHMHEANFCNLGSLFSFAMTVHECWVQGICMLFQESPKHVKIINVYKNFSILLIKQFHEISITLNNDVNIILNQEGYYNIISSTSAIQCNTDLKSSSVKVGLYIFLLQHTKITAVVLLPGEMWLHTHTHISTPHKSFFTLPLCPIWEQHSVWALWHHRNNDKSI
jgi:hypothetical protein